MHIYIDTDRLICVLMHLSYDMDVDWLVSLNQKFKWFSIFILLQFYLHKPLLFERLLRMRARAKMTVKEGLCTTGCDERELCV